MPQTVKNRLILISIVGMPVTMILAASWLWYFVVRGDLDLVGTVGTSNRGTLVQPPRQMADAELFDQSGSVFKYGDLEPKWAMLVPAPGGRCSAACEHSLYLTRQIHVAMGKDFNRLRRFYLSEAAVQDTTWAGGDAAAGRPAPADFAGFLDSEHRGLRALVLGAGSYAQLFGQHQAAPGTWYLADAAGWIMMSYDTQVSYRDVIADLTFLLKNSGE